MYLMRAVSDALCCLRNHPTPLVLAYPLALPCDPQLGDLRPLPEKTLWITRGYCGYLGHAKLAPAAFPPLFGQLKNVG